MSLNVGDLIAYLRLDSKGFEDDATRAQAMADKLDGKRVDVKVDADTSAAEAKLAGVAASEDKVAASGHDAGKGMSAIVAASLALGPALVPIAAGAAGLAVGLSAMGAAGVLAIVGIRQQMAAGTDVGVAYTSMLTTLKGDLSTLGQTAAKGVLGPFQSAVADLQTKMPALNGQIGELSTVTGKTAGVITGGLVAAFLALAPLEREASVYIYDLSNRFAGLMSGPGVVAFGNYARSVFPQVMQAVESVVGAAGHLVEALAPLGMGSLGILRTLADVINALPVQQLAAVAQVAAAVYIGFEAFKLLEGPIRGVASALTAVKVSEEGVTAATRALTIASGVIGAVLGVATLIYSAFADSQQKNTQAANDFADAIRKDNDAIGQNTRLVAAKALQDSGAAENAQKLGYSLSQVTDAVTGNVAMMAKINDSSKAAIEAFAQIDQNAGPASKAITAQGVAAGKLQDELHKLGTELQNGVQANKDAAAATAASTAATDPAAAAQAALASKLGVTSAALVMAATQQKATADAAGQATAKMYLEHDTAGLLKTALDQLNGKAISAADAQNAFDSSLVNMGDHLTATGSKVHFTTTSIDDMSSASVALRGQLNSQITNLQNVAEANGGLSDSTGKAKAQMEAMRQQIIDNAVAHGVDKDAVTAYIDKLLKIPTDLPPSKPDFDASQAAAKVAAYQAMLASLPTHLMVTIGATTAAGLASTYASQVPRGHALGGLVGHASGGLVQGPGTPTSDSILGVNAAGIATTSVSTDEFIVNAAATAKNLPLLEAINAGQNVGKAGNGMTVNNYITEATSAEATAMQVTRRMAAARV